MNKSISLLHTLLLSFVVLLPASALPAAQRPQVNDVADAQRPAAQKKDWHDGWNDADAKDPKGQPRKGGKCNRERFRQEVSSFITREVGLTPDEARKFFPVFFEMREKQHALDRQKARALRLAAERNLSDRDCARVLDDLQRLSKKSLRIETTYMERLEKLVGARKLVKALRADRKFGRKMFRQRHAPKKVVKPARLQPAARTH